MFPSMDVSPKKCLQFDQINNLHRWGLQNWAKSSQQTDAESCVHPKSVTLNTKQRSPSVLLTCSLNARNRTELSGRIELMGSIHNIITYTRRVESALFGGSCHEMSTCSWWPSCLAIALANASTRTSCASGGSIPVATGSNRCSSQSTGTSDS